LVRARHTPLRSCAACSQKLPKGQLTRIVRGIDGRVEADPTGKKSGRGAYLCDDDGCRDAGVTRGRIERALKSSVTEEDRAALVEYFRHEHQPAGIGDVR
jgi:predicted RNA-binding protein YlxR (DUF448 family)